MTLLDDSLYMRRAMELAQLGRGAVSPNPLVGSVVVCEGKIIGEGYHERYGEAHAEVNALAKVRDEKLFPQSTLYVNLEPCSHYGKTPPCADLILRKRVRRVVLSNLDPNPLVAGKGLGRLKEGGVEVAMGVLQEKGESLNRRFFTFMREKRPYIILKWAETADGFIARENYDSKWISDDFSRQLVHKWRAEEDAVMVGTNTAIYDNPRLNVRDWTGRNPLRVLLDQKGKVPTEHAIFDQSQRTICYTEQSRKETGNNEFVHWKKKEQGLRDVLHDLFLRKVQSVIVEGGAALLNSFLETGLWDEARIFKSATRFRSGISAPLVRGTFISADHLHQDTLFVYHRKESTVL